ncbi:hypothetical protein JCM17846_06400 [Iodidimonas nitroreducens]|uniref:Parvulin-like PPIase n=1 Tax=Iodidimonas nitroreducens TaxID=1236968 RepID=A0A5A7N4A0_9PROT|nr:SurA N-terminal domain-containing protein [Iodidimonas nitroreducens]GAK32815.1 peptidyl-prolyl cis-trans isomerase D [alpha proteobacterium Q-1]GER02958.1 hypothetical protein JCM17846_06400 [Iodidimonas nitroreducens]
MLSAIRSTLGSFVVLALLGLLIASFALWGIPDLFSNTGGRTIASVGDSEIDVVEFDRAYNQRLRQIESQIGQPIDRQQALGLGIPQQVLQQLISEQLFVSHARDLGLRGSNRQVVDILRGVEAFAGFDGKFDRQAYENQIARAGLTAAEFETSLRTDIVRRQMLQTLVAGRPVPDALAKPLFRFRNEGRKATILSVLASEIGAVDAPSEDELLAAYELEKSGYMTPPYRAIAVAEISPASVAKPENITDEELATAYEERLAQFQIPELRTVDIVSFGVDEKEKAETFVRRIESGEDFASLVKEMTDFSVDEITLGDVSRTDLETDYNARVADAVFATDEGALSPPAQSVFGWHVFRVRSITPPLDRPLDQVAATLRQDLAEEKALETVYDISVKAEDMLARGVGLKEIANELGLTYAEATVSRDGRLAEGGAVEGAVARHLAKGWELAIDEPALLEPSDDGGFVLVDVVDEIPPQQRPFEDVRTQLLNRLINERKLAQAGAQAETIATALRAGKAAADLAKENDAGLASSDWVIRSRVDQGQQVAPVVGRLMFRMDVGEISVERTANGDGYVIVRLDEVKPGDPAQDPVAYDALIQDLGTALLNDALVQYENALRADLGVEVNSELFQQIVDPQAALTPQGGF